MKIEHIGIATRNLDAALLFWRDALGLEVTHTEVVEEQGVRVAMLPVGEPRIELLEPTHENSPVAKFLEKRGAGIHHVAVRVEDIRASLARLKGQGARLIDESPRVGAGGCLIAFVHPQSAGGVLLELVEHAPSTTQGQEQKGNRFALQEDFPRGARRRLRLPHNSLRTETGGSTNRRAPRRRHIERAGHRRPPHARGHDPPRRRFGLPR